MKHICRFLWSAWNCVIKYTRPRADAVAFKVIIIFMAIFSQFEIMVVDASVKILQGVK